MRSKTHGRMLARTMLAREMMMLTAIFWMSLSELLADGKGIDELHVDRPAQCCALCRLYVLTHWLFFLF